MNKLRMVPTQLARKVTLAFGFLAFIPLLLIFWASVSFIYGGLLHDVGKIGIKDSILLKGHDLTPEEREIMQQHPRIGEAILKPLRSLASVAELVRCHHERVEVLSSQRQ